MTTNFNLRMTAGDSMALSYAILKKDGSVQSLVGATVQFSIWQQDRYGVWLATLWLGEVGDGITITNAAGGLLTVSVPKATVILPGTHRYELEVALPDNSSHTYAAGGLIVLPAGLPQS